MQGNGHWKRGKLFAKLILYWILVSMLSAVIEYSPVLLMTFMRAPSSDSSIIESEDIPQDWMQWVVLREGNNRKCLTPEHEGLCGFIDLIWLENCITHRIIIIKSCATFRLLQYSNFFCPVRLTQINWTTLNRQNGRKGPNEMGGSNCCQIGGKN